MRKQDRTGTHGWGEMKEKRGSCIQGCTITGGEISWYRRGASGHIKGECRNQSVAGKKE